MVKHCLYLGLNEGAPHRRSSLRYYIRRRTEEQEVENLDVAAEQSFRYWRSFLAGASPIPEDARNERLTNSRGNRHARERRPRGCRRGDEQPGREIPPASRRRHFRVRR